MNRGGAALNRLRGWATLASRVAAGASIIIAAWYAIAMLGVELPEPGAIQPFHPAYVDVRPAWAMLLALAYLPALKYAAPLLLLLAAAPSWTLATASLATLILYRRRLVGGLLWALIGLEALALCEQAAVLLGLRPYGLFIQVEKTLRLAASTATLPLLIALMILGPLKYAQQLAGGGGRPAGGWRGRPLHLLPAVLLSLAVACMPYLPTINPEAKLVGGDPTRYYPWWIQKLEEDFTFTHSALRSRPLFVLLIYGLSRLVGVYWAMRAIQLLCFASYTVATYYFTLWLAGEKAAQLAALLFPLSYAATVLIHSGYYNNMLAASLSLPAIALMENWLWSCGARRLALGLVLYEAALLTHPYSTLFYAVALGGVAILRRGRRGLALLAIATVFAAQSEIMSMGFGERAATQILDGTPLTLGWAQATAFIAYNCAINAAIDATNWILAIVGLVLTRDQLLTSITAVTGTAVLLTSTSSWGLRWRVIYAVPLTAYQAITLRNAGDNVKILALLLLANYTINYILNIG